MYVEAVNAQVKEICVFNCCAWYQLHFFCVDIKLRSCINPQRWQQSLDLSKVYFLCIFKTRQCIYLDIK